MLCMKMTRFYTDMVPWLVDHFNPIGRRLSCSLEKGFDVTKDDIFDLFGLPKGDVEVTLIKKLKKTKNPDDSYMDEIKEMLGLKKEDVLTNAKLGVVVQNLKDGGDQFKKLFVLYVLSVFLTPTANGHTDLYLSKAVADVSKIRNTDWCSFVLKTLCDGIEKFQKKKSKRVMGCVLALQIICFHRFIFRGEKAPTKLPLIQHWSDDVVSKRLNEEKHAGFGLCSLDNKTYPVSKKKKKDKKSDEHHDSSNVASSSVENIRSSCSGRILQIQLPEHLSTDDEIKTKAKDECHETCLFLQRDLELIWLMHIKRLNNMKEIVKEEIEVQDASDSPVLSQMSKILSDPENLRYIDSLIEQFLSMKKVSDDMPSFELLSPPQVDNIKETIYKVARDVEESCVFDEFEFENGDDILCLFSSFNCGAVGESIHFISLHMHRNKEMMKKLPSLQQQVVDYSLFRVTSDDSNDVDFKNFGLNHLETLFRFGEYVISRDEMITMEFCSEVSGAVIIAWAAILNDFEKKLEGARSRFYFGMHHSYFLQKLIANNDEEEDPKIREKLRNNMKSWIMDNSCLHHIKKASLIFIPLLVHSHYFCVAVNFDLKEVQFLDNRKYDDSNYEMFLGYGKMVVDELIVLMDSLLDKRWLQVDKFEYKNMPFAWKSTKPNSDCGVFMMLHMLAFKGSNFPADFDKGLRRRVYRSSICAAIVLSDRNEVQQQILDNVKEFNEKKKDIEEMVAEKKRKRILEEKEKENEKAKEVEKEKKKKKKT